MSHLNLWVFFACEILIYWLGGSFLSMMSRLFWECLGSEFAALSLHGNKMPETVASIMQNKELVYVFREFLHEVYNNENLSFWLEIERFRDLEEKEISERATEIWGKYFIPDSPYELNIPHNLRKVVEEQRKTPNKKMFDSIQEHIKITLETDCLPHFLRSEKYKNFIGKNNNLNLSTF
jgi:hypothetical protein